jgi:hypothetical protein
MEKVWESATKAIKTLLSGKFYPEKLGIFFLKNWE